MSLRKRLMTETVKIAKWHATEGHGEEGGNNTGKWVYYFRKHDGTGKRISGRGDWCASFASSCFMRASETLGMTTLPFNTSRGARRLVRNVGIFGREISPREIWACCAVHNPGGLISWKRWYKGRWHPWKGHVGIWYDYCPHSDTLYTIEGNHNVRARKLSMVDLVEYPNGSWRKRLDRIVTL